MIRKSDPWRRHRILKRWTIASVFLMFSSIAFLLIAQIDLRSRGAHYVVYGWMVMGLVMLTLIHEVRCPRCGQRFYVKRMDFWQMSNKCLHCGQVKYADIPTPSTTGQMVS